MAEPDDVQELPPPARSPLRTALTWITKLGLVAAIFAYLIYKGSIKASDLSDLARRWPWALLALSLFACSSFICAFRYKILLRALDITARFRDIFPITLIGMLFDLLSPVGSGGDLVKVYYVSRASRRVPDGKPGVGVLLLSVFLDRVVGFFGLFLLGLIVSVLAWSEIRDQEKLRRMTAFIALICVGVTLGFFVMVSERLEGSALRKRLMHIIPFHEKIERIYAGFAGLRHHKRPLLAMVLLSVLNHLFVCMIILALAQGMLFQPVAGGEPVPLPVVPCLTILPIGITLNTFGVAGGFGIGNLAFEELFNRILGLQGGAGLILAYQLVGVLFRLSGIPFLLLYRRSERSS